MATLLPDRPWQVVATDLLELKGVDYLIVIDYFSRYNNNNNNNNNNNKSLLRMNLQSDVQVYKYRNENKKNKK